MGGRGKPTHTPTPIGHHPETPYILHGRPVHDNEKPPTEEEIIAAYEAKPKWDSNLDQTVDPGRDKVGHRAPQGRVIVGRLEKDFEKDVEAEKVGDSQEGQQGQKEGEGSQQ